MKQSLCHPSLPDLTSEGLRLKSLILWNCLITVSPKINAAQLNHPMAQHHTRNFTLKIKDKQHPTSSKQVRRTRQLAMVALPSSQASGIQ
jgi:hypothetical protein